MSLRSGLHVVLDRTLPLTGALPSAARRRPARRSRAVQKSVSFARVESYFTKRGLSLVAGRAALVPEGQAPGRLPQRGARGRDGRAPHGLRLPVGSVALDEDAPIPVVRPSAVAAKLLAAIAEGNDAALSLGRRTPRRARRRRRSPLLVHRPRVRRTRQAGRRRLGSQRRDDRRPRTRRRRRGTAR